MICLTVSYIAPYVTRLHHKDNTTLVMAYFTENNFPLETVARPFLVSPTRPFIPWSITFTISGQIRPNKVISFVLLGVLSGVVSVEAVALRSFIVIHILIRVCH